MGRARVKVDNGQDPSEGGASRGNKLRAASAVLSSGAAGDSAGARLILSTRQAKSGVHSPECRRPSRNQTIDYQCDVK